MSTPLNPPVVSPKTYLVVWIALMLLLLLNWGLAQFNLGIFNLVATLAIPFIQMILMLLFLMHVRYSPRLTWVFVAAGFIWFLVLVDLSLSDYLTRGSVAGRFEQSWQHTNAIPPPIDLPKP
jgi:cytochrome c oxidase subunit 4